MEVATEEIPQENTENAQSFESNDVSIGTQFIRRNLLIECDRMSVKYLVDTAAALHDLKKIFVYSVYHTSS